MVSYDAAADILRSHGFPPNHPKMQSLLAVPLTCKGPFVGNLYLNRGITGALVGRQPFGGHGLSGVGSKAGGPDYLLQFVEPRVVTENTMRHGLVVDG